MAMKFMTPVCLDYDRIDFGERTLNFEFLV